MSRSRISARNLSILVATLGLLTGCGGPVQDAPDTAEVIRPDPAKPATTTEATAPPAPEAPTPKDIPKD
jgi:hypothetical protein